MTQLKKIDHIAIATDNFDESLAFYSETLGLKCSLIEELPERGIKIAFIEIGEVKIELCTPLHEHSEISGFLQKRGPGIHHIALESTNIDQDMESLKAKGLPFTTEQARAGAHHTQVAFIHPKASKKVLIELVEHNEQG